MCWLTPYKYYITLRAHRDASIQIFIGLFNIYIYIIFLWLWPIVGHGLLILRFLHHTQRHTTVSRTSLDEWSAHYRDLYLTAHNSHKRQMSMLQVGFKPTISAGERWQSARLLAPAIYYCISLCVELFSVIVLFPSVFGYVVFYLLLVWILIYI